MKGYYNGLAFILTISSEILFDLRMNVLSTAAFRVKTIEGPPVNSL